MNEGPGTAELKWNVWFMRELMKKGANGNELELMLNVGDVNAANLILCLSDARSWKQIICRVSIIVPGRGSIGKSVASFV